MSLGPCYTASSPFLPHWKLVSDYNLFNYLIQSAWKRAKAKAWWYQWPGIKSGDFSWKDWFSSSIVPETYELYINNFG